MKYILGLMSGTSCDGVSLALCSFQKNKFKIHAHADFPYRSSLRGKLNHSLALKTPELSQLHFELGIYFADCAAKFLKKIGISKSQIAGIGSHGQTLYHGPKDHPRNTLQLGEASFLAERFGCPVVSDFRPRDIAAGGSGAPLIPFFDAYFFGKGRNIALQNIGGIGNVTFLSKTGKIIAFDTGPGNCLIDLAVHQMSRGKKKFDEAGKIAKSGWIDAQAIQKMIRHPFFKEKPPKSTGRELFNRDFIQKYVRHLNNQDQIATLTFFTAYSIFESYRKFLPSIQQVIVSGGGSRNLTLMRHLEKLFGKVPVHSIESLGIPTQAKEPAAFAFFAWRALHHKINHAPQGTGAKKSRILGKLIFP